MRKAKMIAGKAFSAFMTLLLIVSLALAVAITVVPWSQKGASLTVLSGSMEPTYMPGDLVVVVPREHSTLTIGDVISFHPNPDDPTLVTHRIIGKMAVGDGTYSFATQGDNNPSPDDQPVLSKMIAGKVIYSIPKLGFLAQGLGQNKGGALLAVIALLYAYAIFSFARAIVEHRRKKKAAGEGEDGKEAEGKAD